MDAVSTGARRESKLHTAVCTKLHTKELDGEKLYLVWTKKINPGKDAIVADEEICDLTDEIINARIKLRR